MAVDLLGWIFSGDDSTPVSQDRIDLLLARLSPEPGRLTRSGARTEAVRAVREETGASLREALAAVQALAQAAPSR